MIFKILQRPANLILFSLFALLLFMGHRTGFISILSLFCILIVFLVPWNLYIDGLSVLILAFTISFTAIGIVSGFITDIHTMIAYFIPSIFFYCLGRYIVDVIDCKEQLLWLVLVIIALYLFEIYFSIFQSVTSTGNIINTSRLFYFNGNEGRQLTATLVGLGASLGFVGLPMSIIYKSNRLIRVLYFFLFLFSLITTIHLVNRTGLVICVCVLAITLIYYHKSNVIKIFWGVIICFFLYLLLNKLGVISSDVFDAYAARNETDLTTGGDRTEKWEEALQHLFTSPFGWAENNGTTEFYVHNMWLDIAKVTGLLPFFLLILCTISSFRTLFKLLTVRKDIVVALLLSLNGCFFMSCFVEPVYGGLHFFLYVMIWGVQKQYLLRFCNS